MRRVCLALAVLLVAPAAPAMAARCGRGNLKTYARTSRVLVYTIDEQGTGFDVRTYIRLANLHTGHFRAVDIDSNSDPYAIVLNKRGHVAWITRPRDEQARGIGPIEVHVLDARRRHIVDTGDDIAPRSLRLRGHRLSWVKAGRRVSMRFS